MVKTPTWCPGCGNFALWASLRVAFKEGVLSPHKTVVVYDIGCCGNMADFLSSFGVHALHGRAVAVAAGIKLVAPRLQVVVVGGDGGIYGEGLNHLLAAARANLPLAVIVANNHLYSLTAGQASPTTPKGWPTRSTPFGAPLPPLDPLRTVAAVNPKAFLARGNTESPQKLRRVIFAALRQPRFALVDVEQRCVTFGERWGRKK